MALAGHKRTSKFQEEDFQEAIPELPSSPSVKIGVLALVDVRTLQAGRTEIGHPVRQQSGIGGGKVIKTSEDQEQDEGVGSSVKEEKDSQVIN